MTQGSANLPHGRVLAVLGVVVDVRFEGAQLPKLNRALVVEWDRPAGGCDRAERRLAASGTLYEAGEAELATVLERLSEEYVFAQLHMAALNAYETENQARMRAMAAAKTDIETKLAGLLQQGRQLRQDEITDEIIELTVGAEATRR